MRFLIKLRLVAWLDIKDPLRLADLNDRFE